MSSGYAADPEMYEKVKIEYTQDALEKLGVKIDHADAFGGSDGLHQDLTDGLDGKEDIKQVSKKDSKMDLNGWNDLRDWDKITHSHNDL